MPIKEQERNGDEVNLNRPTVDCQNFSTTTDECDRKRVEGWLQRRTNIEVEFGRVTRGSLKMHRLLAHSVTVRSGWPLEAENISRETIRNYKVCILTYKFLRGIIRC